MLIISTWVWGNKYSDDYLRKLRDGVKRHLKLPYVWRVFHPEPGDEYLTLMPGCFCRLRVFDRRWREAHDIYVGDRVVCMDLDSIVTGSLDSLFQTDEPFQILQGANSANPGIFNGSIWSVVAG